MRLYPVEGRRKLSECSPNPYKLALWGRLVRRRMYWVSKMSGWVDVSKRTSPVLFRVMLKEKGVSVKANWMREDSWVPYSLEGLGRTCSCTWKTSWSASSIKTWRRVSVIADRLDLGLCGLVQHTCQFDIRLSTSDSQYRCCKDCRHRRPGSNRQPDLTQSEPRSLLGTLDIVCLVLRRFPL